MSELCDALMTMLAIIAKVFFACLLVSSLKVDESGTQLEKSVACNLGDARMTSPRP